MAFVNLSTAVLPCLVHGTAESAGLSLTRLAPMVEPRASVFRLPDSKMRNPMPPLAAVSAAAASMTADASASQSARTQHQRMANAIRALAMDAVEQAKSGHPGMPMGVADIATILFTRVM